MPVPVAAHADDGDPRANRSQPLVGRATRRAMVADLEQIRPSYRFQQSPFHTPADISSKERVEAAVAKMDHE